MQTRYFSIRAAVVVVSLGALAAAAEGPVNTLPVDNVIREQVTGEPYRIYGTRIVFTNWQYVSPDTASRTSILAVTRGFRRTWVMRCGPRDA